MDASHISRAEYKVQILSLPDCKGCPIRFYCERHNRVIVWRGCEKVIDDYLDIKNVALEKVICLDGKKRYITKEANE